MKIRVLSFLFLINITLQAQQFPFSDTLLRPLDKKSMTEIKNELFGEFSFGTLNYYISSSYFQNPGETKPPATLSEKILSIKKHLASSKNIQDSLPLLFDLHKYYIALGKYNAADSVSIVISAVLNRELSKENNVHAWLLTYAGKWNEECNRDPQNALLFYQQAVLLDTLDTSAYKSLYALYARYGLYEKADSLFFIGLKRYKNFNILEYVPMLVGASFVKLASLFSVGKEMDKACLSQTFQMGFLDKIEKSTYPPARAMATLSKLLYYVGRYGMQMGKSNQPVQLLPCDQDSLQLFKKRILTYSTNVSYGLPFIFEESLGWIYILLNKPDSSLFWFTKAQQHVESYGVTFYDKNYTVQFARTYVYINMKKDTTKAIAGLEKILNDKEKVGLYPDNYMLLAKWYAMKKMYSKALVAVDSFMKFPLVKTEAKLLKAMILYLNKQKKEAFDTINQIISEVGIGSPKPYAVAALLYLMDNQSKEAYKYLISGYAIDTQYPLFLEIGQKYYKPKKMKN
jgi:tetratricopeptide (TPR) repeat protein